MNKVNFAEGIGINNCFQLHFFFKEINGHGIFHAPKFYQHDLFYCLLCPELFFTEEPVFLYSVDYLFDSDS